MLSLLLLFAVIPYAQPTLCRSWGALSNRISIRSHPLCSTDDLAESGGRTFPEVLTLPTTVTLEADHFEIPIGAHDFALLDFGAEIIPNLTFATERPRGGWTYLHSFTNLSDPHYFSTVPLISPAPEEWHSPLCGEYELSTTALVAGGQCWGFAGFEGQIGVSLQQPARITHLLLHHLSTDRSTAPRDMTAWAVIDSDTSTLHNLSQISNALYARLGLPTVRPASLYGRYAHIPLALFRYDVDSSHEAQVFPVFQEVSQLPFPVSVVILQVNSNWGGQYTHIYKFGVLGAESGQCLPCVAVFTVIADLIKQGLDMASCERR